MQLEEAVQLTSVTQAPEEMEYPAKQVRQERAALQVAQGKGHIFWQALPLISYPLTQLVHTLAELQEAHSEAQSTQLDPAE